MPNVSVKALRDYEVLPRISPFSHFRPRAPLTTSLNMSRITATTKTAISFIDHSLCKYIVRNRCLCTESLTSLFKMRFFADLSDDIKYSGLALTLRTHSHVAINPHLSVPSSSYIDRLIIEINVRTKMIIDEL